jgi:translation initiation factor 2 subunit 1
LKLEDLGIKKDIAELLTKIIKEKIKLPSVEIKGTLSITSYESDGVETIRQALSKIKDKEISMTYLGSGKYHIVVVSPDYKSAEKLLKQKVEAAVKFVEKNKGIANFAREG